MKDVKIIQVRAYQGIDNPHNTAVFIKYYVAGEFNKTHGILVPNQWINDFRREDNQFENTEKYDKKFLIKTSDDQTKYLVTYGNSKEMTMRQFFQFFGKWAAKIKPVESAEFSRLRIKETTIELSLSDLLQKSNDFLFKQFDVIEEN